MILQNARAMRLLSDEIVQFFGVLDAVIKLRPRGLDIMPLIVDNAEQAVAIVFGGGEALVENVSI